jgi:hypothetical protein
MNEYPEIQQYVEEIKEITKDLAADVRTNFREDINQIFTVARAL